MAPNPEALRELLRAHRPVDVPALPGRRNDRRAGILVPVRFGADPECILTLRAADLDRHAGEVSFPGGRPEPEDRDLEATALREAREELGIASATVLGRLSTMPLYTSEFRLVPFVAALGEEPLVADPVEVARIVTVRLREVFAREAIDAIPWTDRSGESTLSPVFEVDGLVVYGGTAHVLYELLQVAAPMFERPVPSLRPGRHRWSDLL